MIVFLLFVVSRLPLWGEGLLPFRYSEAFYPSVILRLAEESNPFRSFADAQDDSKNLFMIKMKPAASLTMTMKPLTSLKMTIKTCSGDIKADCLFFVNASF